MTQMTQMQGVPDGQGDHRTYQIIGAAIEVHQKLGPGFLEPVYQEALAIEFGQRGIAHLQQVQLPIWYKGRELTAFYRADFVCFGEVVVELKALKTLAGVEEAQIINYLKASRLRVGLLLNFGGPWLTHKRFAKDL